MMEWDGGEMDDGGDRRRSRRIDQVDRLGCERQDALSVCLSPGTCTETAGRTTCQATPWGSTTDRRGSSDTGSWEAPCLSQTG